MNEPRKQVMGEYRVEHLRPIPEKMQEFLPLWTARNAHIEAEDRALAALDEHKAAEPRAQDGATQAQWDAWAARMTELNDIRRMHTEAQQTLTEQMRPLQHEASETEVFHNLITTVGKNDLLDKYLKGSTYTQTIRMGLKGAGSANAADTQASHAGWTERGGTNAPAYTGNRKDVTMGSAAAGVSTSPTQAFAITSSGTVDGCFINNGGSATKDDTTGILFSAGDFSGGAKTVANLDTLNVVYTLTAT